MARIVELSTIDMGVVNKWRHLTLYQFLPIVTLFINMAITFLLITVVSISLTPSPLDRYVINERPRKSLS